LEEESLDIRPSPRLLRMLKYIELNSFQCICELVDNSIDAFDGIINDDKTLPEIIVKIPKERDIENNGILIIDNGIGMNKDQLNSSITAGFSGNNTDDKMGLFGMGFNISTAKLGGITEVTTYRKEDDFKLWVKIDLNKMSENNNFLVPFKKIPKSVDEIGSHGTRIEISSLNIEFIKSLRRAPNIIKKLGRTYGKILRDRNIKLIYEGKVCKPFAHCTFDRSRIGKNNTPTVIDIDKPVGSQRYCTFCMQWLLDSDFNCSSCGENKNIIKREKKVKGWIGLQRFFDQEEYGFDLIRNGRVIKKNDKSLFTFVDEEDDFKLFEYPVDSKYAGGRFIGELEIDFVPVNFQKTDFERSTKDWRDFVAEVRGVSPIQPRKAKDHNYPENNSALGKLFLAFRNAKPEPGNFVPANPETKQAIISSSQITELRDKFFEGYAEYQDDKKWIELIKRGELPATTSTNINNNNSNNDSFSNAQTGGDLFGNNNTNNGISNPSQSNNSSSTNQNVSSDIQLTFEKDESLSNTYNIDLFSQVFIKVDAKIATSGSNENGFLIKSSGGSFTFTYWPKSKIFKETFLTPADLLINELAYHFFIGADAKLELYPFSLIERSILHKYFPNLHPEIDYLSNEIEKLTEDMKDHLKESIKTIKQYKSSDLSYESIKKIRKKMNQGNLMNEEQMNKALEKAEFFNFADLNVCVEIFKKYPETLFDGVFFSRKIEDKDHKNDVEEDLIKDGLAMFDDIIWWQINGTSSSNPIWKGRSKRVIGSLEVINGWKS